MKSPGTIGELGFFDLKKEDFRRLSFWYLFDKVSCRCYCDRGTPSVSGFSLNKEMEKGISERENYLEVENSKWL